MEDGGDRAERAEQKRKREQRRRSNLTQAFEELEDLLNTIEDDEHVKSGDDATTARGATVRRATLALHRLLLENSELKMRLSQVPASTTAEVQTSDRSNMANMAHQPFTPLQTISTANPGQLAFQFGYNLLNPLGTHTAMVGHRSEPNLQYAYKRVSY